jgi:hypothetical protein
LQSKDLDCELTGYQIAGEPLRIYAEAFRVDETSAIDEERRLVIVTTKHYAPATNIEGEIAVYTHCDACDPIVYERGGLFGRSADTDTCSPWCEWALVVKHGEILRHQGGAPRNARGYGDRDAARRQRCPAG